MLALCTMVTFLRPLRTAYSKANSAMRRQPARVLTPSRLRLRVGRRRRECSAQSQRRDPRCSRARAQRRCLRSALPVQGSERDARWRRAETPRAIGRSKSDSPRLSAWSAVLLAPAASVECCPECFGVADPQILPLLTSLLYALPTQTGHPGRRAP